MCQRIIYIFVSEPIKTRLVKPYIAVTAANTVGKFFDVFAASATWKFGPGFISMSPERNNSRLVQMLWLKCEFFMSEALWQKFDCYFELIKAKLTQICLMTNQDMESFL